MKPFTLIQNVMKRRKYRLGKKIIISLEGEILKLAKPVFNFISLEGEILKLAKPVVKLISLEGDILKLAKPF